MMGNTESSRWADVYTNIKCNHDTAYLAIDEAIKFEEREKPEEVNTISE